MNSFFKNIFFIIASVSSVSILPADNSMQDDQFARETASKFRAAQREQEEIKKDVELHKQFMQAVKNDDVVTALRLYQSGLVDINARDEMGNTVFTHELAFQKGQTIDFILRYADPTVTDANGWTPLMHLAANIKEPTCADDPNVNDEIITELISPHSRFTPYKVSPDTACPFGFTPLMIASGSALYQEKNSWNSQHYEIMMTLIAARANVNAQTNGQNFDDSPTVRLYTELLVLDEECDMHATATETNSRNGFTALMIAARNEQLDKVKLLLFAGANTRLKNSAGETAVSLTESLPLKKILVNGLSEEEHDAIGKDFVTYTGKDLVKSKINNLFIALRYKSMGISPATSLYLQRKKTKQEIIDDDNDNEEEQTAEQPVKRLKTTH